VEFVLVVAALSLLAALTTIFGVDTRDADDWSTHRPA
jgi:hypothetical protein